MKSAEETERLMKQFCKATKGSVRTSHKMNRSVLDDALAAYGKSKKKPVAAQPNVRRITMKRTVMRHAALAAAAAIIVAVLFWTNLFWGSGQQQDYEIAKNHEEPQLKPMVQEAVLEQKDIDVMLAAGNVDGLVTMVSQADFKAQVGAANYLARMDRVEALEALEKLSAGHPGEDSYSPFVLAVEKIRNRINTRKDQSTTATEGRQPDTSTRNRVPLGLVAVDDNAKGIGPLVERNGEELQEDAGETDDTNLESGAAEAPLDGETLPELTEGASGYGYYFDGDGDYIEIGPIEGLGPEQTKMFWVYADPFEEQCNIYLLDEGGDESNNNWIELCGSDGNSGVQIRAGFDGDNLFDSNSGIHAESWHHIAVVSTAAGEMETYINGALDSWRSGFSAKTTPKAIVIGADGESKTACFKGIIDEVAIFNRALSDEEIWRIYQNLGRLRGYEQGLVGYWNFDNDEGDVVRDRSRYGNHGKLGGW